MENINIISIDDIKINPILVERFVSKRKLEELDAKLKKLYIVKSRFAAFFQKHILNMFIANKLYFRHEKNLFLCMKIFSER
jgi:predicted transcriptional regulator